MDMPLPKWLIELSKLFQLEKKSLYLVGGATRSFLLGMPIKEWDCATNALPNITEKIMRQAKLKNINLVGKRFGTIMGEFNGELVEITTFRSESYKHDSRNPSVTFGDSIETDLSRRDFTINTIALELPSKKLLDPYKGQLDLTHKIVRTVGTATDRFTEDPLRMLRAIRFAVQLGFTIEHQTFSAITTERERFAILTVERINQELNKILLADKPSRGIELLVESGLINYILPEILPSIDIAFDPREHKDIYAHILQVLDRTPPKLELRWCALLHDIAKPLTRKKIGGEYHFLGHEVVGAKMAKKILSRLRYSNEFINYVSGLVYLHQRLPNDDGNWTDGAIRRFVRDAGDKLDDLFIFAEADSTGKNERKLTIYRNRRENIRSRIVVLEKEAEIAKIKGPLSGEELMELFNKPAGPWIKPIKEKLLQLVLDGELKEADKEKAKEIARELVKK